MIVNHEAVRRGMTPRYSTSFFHRIIQFMLLPMVFIIIGIGLDSVYGAAEGAVATATLFILQIGLHRFNRQQRKQNQASRSTLLDRVCQDDEALEGKAE